VQHRPSGRKGKFCGDESARGIKIAVPGFVDDADVPESFGAGISYGHIDLPPLKGDLVAGVV
jgi:hypothetical protein